MSFTTFGLDKDLLRAVAAQGYTTPTPIQTKAIPAVMEGRDVLAGARTGTGKTAAFALPILQRLNQSTGRFRHPRVLVLTPTRELAAQVSESFDTYGRFLSLRTAVIFGGVNINPQKAQLRKGVDIVVATPGRLLDHAGQKTIDLSKVETLVLDEGDRMLDMGFIHDIKKIIRLLPSKRQNMLFSATYSNEIKQLADGLLNSPAEIEVSTRNTAAEGVAQMVYQVPQAGKRLLLSRLIRDGKWSQVLVFTRTKHRANKLTKQLLSDGVSAAAIHGNKSQNVRTRALADFKSGEVQTLVATDIAARGLDIQRLPHVVNFDLPNVAEDYVHRIGRTGRAGADGVALSLVSQDEEKLLKGIQRLLKHQIPVKDSGIKVDLPVSPAGSRPAPKASPGQPRNPRGNKSSRQWAPNSRRPSAQAGRAGNK
ncbi:MAG TPA: DEAD/DEAH box helicase [Desulfobacteraceae bacterium]|nr:DEAD/DEAH box helicase [Desulfobacteraceae bacterium]